MVLFYIVIDFSPTSTTTNARFACALYLRPEGQSFTALFDKYNYIFQEKCFFVIELFNDGCHTGIPLRNTSLMG
ncbi:hypothetical protein [Gallibacterium anatis]|uniref:hypothetical protein n=1 Tax=Gallibacterium anatis TaxID=750 RepID=UPI000BA1210B|nr:hypothetical protein [Gallibacterium anatis]OZN48964.1 hypothetical protein CF595_07365 [Gallibacterium anatis]